MTEEQGDHGSRASDPAEHDAPEGMAQAKALPAGGALAHAPPVYRAGQREAIDEVLRRFREGARSVFLDAPTGSGKSLIHLEVGREIGGAYVTTPQVPLVGQYAADTDPGGKFEGRGVTLVGRRNYPCPYDIEQGFPNATAEGAPCTWKEFLCPVKAEGNCPYYTALGAARSGAVSVHTLAYFLAGITRQLGGQWPSRPILVVDEAHGLVNSVVDHYAVTVARRTFPGIDFDDLTAAPDRLEFLRDNLPTYYQAVMLRLADMVERASDPEEIRREVALKERVKRTYESLTTRGVTWIYRWVPDRDAHTWRPLTVAPFIGGLWSRFDHVLLSSGTFVGFPDLATEIALPRPVSIVRVADSFPPASAPIAGVGSVKLSHKNMGAMVPLVVAEIARIAALHPSERGLVHAHSYDLAGRIVENAPPELRARIVVHGRKDRNAAYSAWVESGRPGSVFVAVGMTEGIDLRDDLARWQVVAKCPFPDLGDPWVTARLERAGGRSWYELTAILSILQAAGRVMRSAEDHGATYILDRHAIELLRRHADEIPAWFRARWRVAP